MKKTRIKFGMIFLVMVFLFCGCAAKSDGTDGKQDVEQDEDIPADDEEDDGRIVITYGVWDMIDNPPAVVAFNNTNEKYRVKVVTHKNMEWDDYHDNLALRLMTGRGEDIVDLILDERIGTYAKKGCLVDLSGYIERDLNKEDYLPGALDLYREGEGVYALAGSFWPETFLGRIEDLGTGDITFQDLPAIMEASDTESFLGLSAIDTLWYLYSYFDMDITNVEELREGILFAEKYDYKKKEEPGPVELGRDLLVMKITMDIETFYSIEGAYGEIGNKTVLARGGAIKSDVVGINAASKNIEGAWEFLRFLVSREQQMKFIDSRKEIPVLKDVAEERFANKYANLEKLNSYNPQGTDAGQDAYLEWMRERKDVYLEMVGNILKYGKPVEMKVDYDAWIIVSEEAQVYYSGQKPLEKVLKSIQSRLKLYLNEQK